MQISYTIYEQRFTPESLGDGEPAGPPEEADAGTGNIAEILRHAVMHYGISPRETNDPSPWFVSDEPRQDREYFERGVEKLYCLNLHNLSARHTPRINRMLKRLCKRS